MSNSKINSTVKRWQSKTIMSPESITTTDCSVSFYVEDQQITIQTPLTSDPDLYAVVDYPELKPRFDWLSKINEFITETDKSPSLGHILWKINKLYKRYHTPMTDLLTTEFIENLDISEEIGLERKLKDKLSSNTLDISLNVSDNSKGIKLFHGQEAGHILLTELMDVRRKFKDSSCITVEPINDSVFQWRVLYTLNSLNVEVNITFNEKYYPGYPPYVNVVKPQLKNRLKQRISNLKMVRFEYWTPTRSMEYVITTLKNILNEHAQIDEMNPETITVNVQNVETVLTKLSALADCDTEEPLDKTEYVCVLKQNTHNNTNSTNTSTSTSNGVGYGNSKSSKWDPKKYVELQKQKDAEIQSLLQKLIENVQSCSETELLQVYLLIQTSYLIPFIKNYLRGTTLLEISKHKDLYHLIFKLLQNFITEKGVFLFNINDKTCSQTVYDQIVSLNKEAVQTLKLEKQIQDQQLNKDTSLDEDALMISSLFDMLEPLQKLYKANIKALTPVATTNTYYHVMNSKCVDMSFKFATTNFKFQLSSGVTSKRLLRRMTKELSSLEKCLPISAESSVYISIDVENCRCMKVLITGPTDTPYDSGVFLFDLYITDDFPTTSPKMVFLNHFGKRFNPNLYNDGKVCLSLLGTWSGQGGENWNEHTSSLIQLLISVQSQILTDKPYFNEPGYAHHMNTPQGELSNKHYNNYIRYYTMSHAVTDILTCIDSYPEFKDVIVNHFKLKKDYMIETYKKWVTESFYSSSTTQQSMVLTKIMYEQVYAKMLTVLNAL